MPVGDDSTKQTFPLSVIVSFVFHTDNIVRGYQPPAPPVLFEVPYDVFYPFLNSNSAAKSTVNAVWSVVGVLICSALLFIAL